MLSDVIVWFFQAWFNLIAWFIEAILWFGEMISLLPENIRTAITGALIVLALLFGKKR